MKGYTLKRIAGSWKLDYHDIWIGFYWTIHTFTTLDKGEKILKIYICPIPLCVFKLALVYKKLG